MPSLDGWRALSIVLVLGSHCHNVYDFPESWRPAFWWLFDGNLGVRCFFLISGFLITTLMLRESAEKGIMDLRSFFLRRALRILPVYFAFLAVVFLLELTTKFQNAPLQWIHLLTFTTNFSMDGNWLTGHTWSLSCEEQFYLIWPPLFLYLGLQVPKRAGIQMLLLTLLVCPIWRVVEYLNLISVSNSSLLNYLDTLAIGCLTAYAHPWLCRRIHGTLSRILTISALVAITVPYILSHAFLLGIFTVPLGTPCQAVGMAWLISRSVHHPTRGLVPLLNLPAMIWLGQLSYSLYLWQAIFCSTPEMFGWEQNWVQSFLFWIPASLVTACISYYLLERPLLGLRKRLHRPAENRLASQDTVPIQTEVS